ncbi:hypothetical protein OAP65_02000 [Litorivicinus sp.]|nr:hypothetical protein [Litorivicinus sp.]
MQESQSMPNQLLFGESGEIFFRESDQARMARLFETVVNDGLHFVMTSSLHGPVDHYGKLFLNRLKMRSGLAVETFMPVSTDALIARFNSMLADVSVNEARDQSVEMQGRVIVVNDLHAIDSESLSLLLRLISDFPGLNVRLVFLADQLPKNMERVLERLGSRLIRWDVTPPSPEEQMTLRREAMQVGLEFQVERVLSRINQSVADQLEPSFDLDGEQPSLQLDANRALDSGTEAGEREAEDMKALFEEDEEPVRSKGRFRLFFMLLIVLIVGAVGAATVSPEVGRLLNRTLALVGVDASFFDREDQGRSVVDAAYDRTLTQTPPAIDVESPKTEVIEPDPAANNAEVNQRLIAATEIATATTTEVEAAQADESVSNAEASEPTQAPPVTDPVEQEVAEQAPEPVSPPAETSTETAAVATAPPVAEPAPIETPAAPVARVVDPVAEKIRAANPGSQFVQHIVLASAARAEEWLGTQSGLDRAVVVAVSINNATRFAVVSGPFETRAEVREYIQGMDQTADYWVRTARSLQRIAVDGDE